LKRMLGDLGGSYTILVHPSKLRVHSALSSALKVAENFVAPSCKGRGEEGGKGEEGESRRGLRARGRLLFTSVWAILLVF
jgi:hypothetical protein